jgi:hypothetical protein
MPSPRIPSIKIEPRSPPLNYQSLEKKVIKRNYNPLKFLAYLFGGNRLSTITPGAAE